MFRCSCWRSSVRASGRIWARPNETNCVRYWQRWPKSTGRGRADMSRAGRSILPAFGFALIDLPSDHEIDKGLVTESQMIYAILHNRGLGSRTKLFRATSEDSFSNISQPYRDLGFVHLATHGSSEGISLIGTHMSWNDVANKMKQIAPALQKNKQRVLCLFCCHSEEGYLAMKSALSGKFYGGILLPRRKNWYPYPVRAG